MTSPSWKWLRPRKESDMNPIWIIGGLFAALAIGLVVSEARNPTLGATRDTSLGAGAVTLGIAIFVAAVCVALLWGV